MVEQVRGIQEPIQAHPAYVALGVVAGLSVLPLSYALPFSTLALALTIGLFVALNVIVLAMVQSRSWSLLLQLANLAAGAAGTALAMAPTNGLSDVGAPLVVFPLCASLLGAGWVRVPKGHFRVLFVVQESVLIVTLFSWLIVAPMRVELSDGGSLIGDHFQMGLRFLFAGPLGFYTIVFVARLVAWRGLLKALAGACLAQYGVGLIEVGTKLDNSRIASIGVLIGLLFFAWLAFLAVNQLRSRRLGAGTGPHPHGQPESNSGGP